MTEKICLVLSVWILVLFAGYAYLCWKYGPHD